MNYLDYTVRKAREGEGDLQTDLLILFLLEGEMTVRYYGEEIHMCRDDILLINPGTEYVMDHAHSALYGVASYSASLTAQIMGGRTLSLYADSVNDTLHSYQDIREILIDLTADYTYRRHQTDARKASLLLKLLDHLIENYSVRQSNDGLKEGESDVRMQQMMQYIISHINEEVNLSALAEQMYVSASTLSRIFRKKTGVYFADYVMQLRVRSSLRLLNYSDQNLTQIAMNCGFSNSASFSRAFRKTMHMSPSEYRDRNRENARKDEKHQIEEEQEIRQELLEKGYQESSGERKCHISLDQTEVIPEEYERVWDKAVNIGSLYSMTNANIQFHVLHLQEHLHFSIIRLWNIFSVKTQVSDGKSLGQYNFDIINQALDFLVKNHLRPFLDFGRRPDTAIRTGGETVYYNEEYILFESREIWEDILSSFIDNIVNRYGQQEVSKWIFELSYDGFHQERSALYQDLHYDFFEAWKTLYGLIRSSIPEAEIGGISSVIDNDIAFNTEFYGKCVEGHCVPDFASFLLFPYENKESVPYLTANPDMEVEQVLRIRQMMQDCGISDRKLYITEWNNTIANRNFLNDSCFRSAYLAAGVIDLWGKTDLLCVMGGTDWVSSYFDTNRVINGGVGLLTKDTIRKPAFFVLAFLNELGSQFLSRGKNYIITRNEKNELIVLFHHFSWFRKEMIPGDEQVDLDEVRKIRFEDEKPLKIELNLLHMDPSGVYAIKNRRLNTSSGSLLDKWRHLGFESDLTREEVKYLQAVSVPEIELERGRTDTEGTLKITVELDAQEVVLMHIYRRRKN
ncbi:GH39 family glycosyl hydrolase [Bilifractor sp. HCP3S3_D3]|uniref:GH39 family glycosyl hydrolase n=1 Tax=Bilifractor sp. HCP3S3_D3 TaxID=3438907 RepID=UPI003F8A9A14